ncbi:helix-turn-helix domain-containing protein [Prosthecochloris vibrioformis]|uniref:Helix-turn-helix domain-containing protein n=1 Tax=Prosthecochloris vibrioformis TaxID=1098 RepID=A0A5C4RSE9_PROVB|nr:helix-turn-helix domain-containing protein [Prosthecochloris vibrioformis]
MRASYSSIRTPAQLGLLLQGYRKELELSQTTAASKVGLSQKTVSALENHTDRCSLNSLFKLLSALDLELVLQPRSAGKPSDHEW